MPTNESLLAQTFVELADTLVDDFDVVDLLTTLADRCTQLLDVGAAGVLLADLQGHLHVMAGSTEQARVLELFQLQNDEGPCLECCATGQAVTNQALAPGNDRWPLFAAEARRVGFVGVSALPMRLRGVVIGALNIFMDDRRILDDRELVVAQALADAATIAVFQSRAASEAQTLAEQLQAALTSRVAIEQAKGILAERHGLDMAEAFERLRQHARNHNRRLGLVAAELVDGTLPATAFAAPSPRRKR